MNRYNLTDWLPTTKKEVLLHGWDQVDIILFSGDAYVDHPSFGPAVIGRILEFNGWKVALVPQPNWRDDLRDFKKLGRPRLFFGVTAGCMDSMVNKYTANKRIRSDDAYTPDARIDMRPEYTTSVYSNILRELYPDVPIVIGGIEASMRRLTHYDYWQDKLLKNILSDSKADILVYGMGEKPICEIAERLDKGETIAQLRDIPQTAFLCKKEEIPGGISSQDIVLYSHEECLTDKKKQSRNFKHIEEESNKQEASRLIQAVDDVQTVVNPPYEMMTEAELDRSFDLPYTRLPHPKYKNKKIPAFEMIKFSVNIHRGCFGGCSFCTISAHQGKFISSRSKASILKEVKAIASMPDFKGNLSDLGGPSANMYKMAGKDPAICKKCKRPSCVHPEVCPNLNADHTPILELFDEIEKIEGIKRVFVSSGVRYDLLLHRYKDNHLNQAATAYTRELIGKHVSGRLKVAPEHTSDVVLNIMRKPSFKQFGAFKKIFDKTNRAFGLKQQLIPYFISSHPGCTEEDMAELAVLTKDLNFQLEQVQDFTPTPMTVATETYYTGIHPYTEKPVYTAKKSSEKLKQRQFFFWYKSSERQHIIAELRRLNRPDLIQKLYGRNY
ncbi:MAG: YgiQ family radical SAM protein [Bacteroidaceae bacterium]